jgi:hypothetical protein
MTVRDKNYIHKEIESTLNSGNACAVQDHLSFPLLSKNINIKIYKNLT